MVPSIIPYGLSYAQGWWYPVGSPASAGWSSVGSRIDQTSLFARYVLNSKPYQQFVRTAATGIVNFLRSAQDMQEAARKLMQQQDSPFQARTARSSDGGKVTAEAKAGAAPGTYSVKVNALAASQKNSGAWLAGTDQSVVGAGLNEFNITIGGRTTKISVFIRADDTNEQALGRIRDAVNAAKIGVTAAIVTDAETGMKRLELTGDQTGTDHAFRVEDVTGNAMSATGAAHVERQAVNASYSVNGGPAVESQSNTIELEKGRVTATLLAVTDEPVTVEVRPDGGRIIPLVRDLVESYNAMYRRLREAEGLLSPSIRRSFDRIVDSTAYERLGITRNADGTLRLDERQLERSLNGSFELTAKTLGGRLGLADRLDAAAERYNEVPASSLLDRQARQLQQLAFYQSSLQMFWPLQPSGLIFDLFF